MQDEAVVLHYEWNIDNFYKAFSDHSVGFRAREVDELQDETIRRLLDRKFYVVGLVDKFHRTWDTIDDERKSLACVYEQHRARFFALTDGGFYRLKRNGYLTQVTIKDPSWRHRRTALEYIYANNLKNSVKKAVDHLRERGHRPAVLGFVHLTAVEVDGVFHWQPCLRLLVGRCEHRDVELGFRSVFDLREELKHGLEVKKVDEPFGCFYISDYTPNLLKSSTGSEQEIVGEMTEQDLTLRSVWMATQSYKDMVFCFGMPKGTRRGLYEAPLEQLVKQFVI